MKWYNKLLGLGALTLASLSFSPKRAKACSSAIPIGRGGTNVSIADGASAAYWNPAGLVQLERPEVDMTLGTGKYKSFLCYGKPLNEKSAIGLNFSYREDEYSGFTSEGVEEDYTNQRFWLRLGYSRKLTDKLSVGANLKIERMYTDGEVITWNHKGKTFQTYLNTDLGILYRANDKIRAGLLLQGYGISHFTCVRPGVSLKLDDKTLLAIEGYDVTNEANSRHIRLGLERKVNDKWSIRGGMRFGNIKGIEIASTKVSGNLGASYRKNNLETSLALMGKGAVLSLNKKF